MPCAARKAQLQAMLVLLGRSVVQRGDRRRSVQRATWKRCGYAAGAEGVGMRYSARCEKCATSPLLVRGAKSALTSALLVGRWCTSAM